MWFPSEDEAVGMFARYFAARHKDEAATEAEQQAESLIKRSGDHDGHRVWSKVAKRIEHLRFEKVA